jgi:hypothetical protein
VPIRPEHRKTFPTARIPETLLMFIRSRGGEYAAMNSVFVYGPLADYYELSEADRTLPRSAYYTDDNRAGSAWESEVLAAVKELKKEGYLVSANRSGKPIWRLTPSGMARADFWLKRMTDKSAALLTLTVNPELAWLEPDDQSQQLAFS